MITDSRSGFYATGEVYIQVDNGGTSAADNVIVNADDVTLNISDGEDEINIGSAVTKIFF